MWFLIWKALHIVALVAWFAGLFYLPRLFVYHANTTDALGAERFCLMERKLYYIITWPSGLLTTLSGAALVYLEPSHLALGWFQIKLALVVLLWCFHLFCGHHVHQFARGQNTKTHVFFRFCNEMPTLVLLGCVALVIFEPQIVAMIKV